MPHVGVRARLDEVVGGENGEVEREEAAELAEARQAQKAAKNYKREAEQGGVGDVQVRRRRGGADGLSNHLTGPRGEWEHVLFGKGQDKLSSRADP